MAAKYDPDLLQQYADRLYRRAKWMVGWYSLVGFLAGALIGELQFYLMGVRSHGQPHDWSGNVLFGLIGLLPGFVYGTGKVFWLRLEAQRTLCQLQIERNTRTRSRCRKCGRIVVNPELGGPKHE